MNVSGWNNTYRISHAKDIISDVICDTCGKMIHGNSLFLVRERSNFKHRGNETDEVYYYHKECRTSKKLKKLWGNYYKKLKEEKELENKREIKRKELIHDINLWGFNKYDLFY